MLVSTSPETSSSLRRWYIDTLRMTDCDESLPLLSTLRQDDQEKVNAYKFLRDRNMSLAAFLLKYLFIHRSCLVPWREIVINKTPAPHGKPYYAPRKTILEVGETGEGRTATEVEFNVSHQASLVALAGYARSQRIDDSPAPCPQPPVIVGIDITCTDEPSRIRRGKGLSHRDPDRIHTKLDKVETYSEIFSDKEMNFLQSQRLQSLSSKKGVADTTTFEERKTHDDRIFFAYWALKEAYIKMVGKGLLYPLVRDVEFRNVVIPDPVTPSSSEDSPRQWGSPITGIEVFMFGKKLADVRVELVAWGKDFLIATAGRSISDAIWEDFKELDVDQDIAPCAKGECDCLQTHNMS